MSHEVFIAIEVLWISWKNSFTCVLPFPIGIDFRGEWWIKDIVSSESSIWIEVDVLDLSTTVPFSGFS